MVTRWETDCIRGLHPRQNHSRNLCRIGGRGPAKQMTKTERYEFYPNWSRDGDSLFCEWQFDKAAIAIYQLNLKTNQLTTLTGSKGKWYPILSPDNNTLSSTDHLMLFDMRTQQWTELTK